jgi:hypothetical protein
MVYGITGLEKYMAMLDLAGGMGFSIKQPGNHETANKKVADAVVPLQNQ